MVTLSSMNVVKMFTVTGAEIAEITPLPPLVRKRGKRRRIREHAHGTSLWPTCLAVSREYLFVSQYKVWGVVVMRWSAELQTFEYAYTVGEESLSLSEQYCVENYLRRNLCILLSAIDSSLLLRGLSWSLSFHHRTCRYPPPHLSLCCLALTLEDNRRGD